MRQTFRLVAGLSLNQVNFIKDTYTHMLPLLVNECSFWNIVSGTTAVTKQNSREICRYQDFEEIVQMYVGY